MNPTYDVQYYIDKFEAIPEELWNADGSYVNKDNPECKCALGHCGADIRNTNTDEIRALAGLFRYEGIDLVDITGINDGTNPEYQQSTPKQRILAALNDVKNGVRV
jgi:hypothetical protein